ncbi:MULTISPECIES: hypothetical protein [unclassified Streptomyces]|uniref:Integral membrane protein n=1 Tax=Streptomyces sp. R33 TaxID=3238629 RepID=A0AB39Y4N3_9ACTN|nr:MULTISPECIES: hypothetical protein [unclassified Streptomyces]KJY36078.1 membrane protein [Streptomyces sp. NRRL S-444]KOY54740.1 membrane protein [Streptomyces sp. XY332]TDU77021.1 hypothetical protein EDD91_3750 [Streptomyces sp. KS 21]THA38595.1 hypothetical protein E6W17_16505 [Streptomyces sp. A1547]
MAHAAPTAQRRHLQTGGMDEASRGQLTRALLLGLVYGVWAAFMQRQTGPVDAGNVFYGILCGALFAGIMFALARVGPRLKREVHAAAYGVFAGIAVGYLNSLTDHSVLRSSWIGLITGAGVGLVAFYRFYQREA